MTRRTSTILISSFLALLVVPQFVPAAVTYPPGATTLHFTFDGAPSDSAAVLQAPAPFDKSLNYGFVNSSPIPNPKGLQAEKYLRFDVALPDGNYDITATLGTPLAESTTTIRSEEHRAMVVDVHTAKDEYKTVPFTVNIHKDVVNKNELNSDGLLHLQFIGQNPSLTRLEIKPNTTAPTIYLVGDSTMCDYNSDPRFGWGQMFPAFFKPGEIAVCNLAKSGRSAKSFIAEKRQEDLFKSLKPGDYMMMQFAHNDMKEAGLTPAAWKTVLMTYIDGTRQRKATPILITSMPRRQFDAGKIKNSLGTYPQDMRDLAKEQNIPLLDLNAGATDFFNILGEEGTTKAFCHYPANMYEGHLAANADNTHFNPYGAYELARIVAREIVDQKLDLAPRVIGNLGPSNTDPAKFSPNLAYNTLLLKK